MKKGYLYVCVCTHTHTHTHICWNTFLGPRWSWFSQDTWLQTKSYNFYAAINAPHNQKPRISGYLILKHQASSGSLLTCFFLIHLIFFSSLLLFLYPIKASFLLPHFAILWTLESGDCLLHLVLKFVSHKLSSLVILTCIKSCLG